VAALEVVVKAFELVVLEQALSCVLLSLSLVEMDHY
jgi:hypothetical protein